MANVFYVDFGGSIKTTANNGQEAIEKVCNDILYKYDYVDNLSYEKCDNGYWVDFEATAVVEVDDTDEVEEVFFNVVDPHIEYCEISCIEECEEE